MRLTRNYSIYVIIKDKTIENIMNMDDAELGLKALMGDIDSPKKKGHLD